MEKEGDSGSQDDILLKLTMPGKELKPQTVLKAQKAEEGVTPQINNSQEHNESQLNQEIEDQQLEHIGQEGDVYEPKTEVMQEEGQQDQPQETVTAEEPQQEEKPEEDVLLKLTMPGKELRPAQEPVEEVQEEQPQKIMTVEPEKEDLPQVPKDHPHIGGTYDMKDIKSLTERLFNSDVVAERLKKQ